MKTSLGVYILRIREKKIYVKLVLVLVLDVFITQLGFKTYFWRRSGEDTVFKMPDFNVGLYSFVFLTDRKSIDLTFMSVSQVLKGLNRISPPTSLSVSEHSIFWVNEHSTYISMTNKSVKDTDMTHTIKNIKVNAKGARSLKVVHRNIQKGNKLSDYDIMMF